MNPTSLEAVETLETGSPEESASTPAGRVSTGVRWLDVILQGGLPINRIYLIVGDPGTGKTTLGLQFLLEGKARGERCMFVSLAESRQELLGVAASHNLDLSGIEIFEVVPEQERARPEDDYTVLHPSEIELSENLHKLMDGVERYKPHRVIIDSMAEIRLMARDSARYRRQIVALKSFLVEQGCTAYFIDTEGTNRGHGAEPNPLETIAHGVLSFERDTPEYGRERRRMQVLKMRGVDFHTGYHDFLIRTGGIVVWPRLVAAEHGREYVMEPVSSGVPALDETMCGGPSRGTTMLVVGASGAGKSTICQQYCMAAAGRGETSAWFGFDERLETMVHRAESMGMDFQSCLQSGMISVEQVDPGMLSPGEFMQRVRRRVQKFNARVVVIDSLNGYLNAMPGERHLLIQMHEMLTYLSQMGVLSIVVIAQPGILSGRSEPPIDMSYLADSILVLRYFEYGGEVHRSLSAVKKREGPHERSIREFGLGVNGIRVGPPLRQFQGVLTGEPNYVGAGEPLMRPADGATL